MSSKSWKSAERKIALLLGAERIPVNGRRGKDRPSDLVNSWLCVEVKTTKRLPVYLAKAMSQAVAGAAFHESRDNKVRLPLIVIHGDNERYGNAIVGILLSDFVEWWGGEESVEEVA